MGSCGLVRQKLREIWAFGLKPIEPISRVNRCNSACKLANTLGYASIGIVTDSKYLFDSATSWIDKWKCNSWLDYKNRPVKNRELFEQLLLAKAGLEIKWLHVKGHGSNKGNIRADALVRKTVYLEFLKSGVVSAIQEPIDLGKLPHEQARVQVRPRLMQQSSAKKEEKSSIWMIDFRKVGRKGTSCLS